MFSIATILKAQSYNTDKVALTNYLVRMYNAAPFDGVRVVDDYDNAYLISVLSLDKTKYKTDYEMNRVASVKAMSQVSRYLNGSKIETDVIIHTYENTNSQRDTEIIERVQEFSMGYVKYLEELTNFTGQNNQQVFIYIKRMNPDGNTNGINP